MNQQTADCYPHWICETALSNSISPVADENSDDVSFCDALRDEGAHPLINHHLFAPYGHVHNARIESKRSHQLLIPETMNLVIKRSDSGAVRVRTWYRQFRELSLTTAVYTVGQPTEL